MKRFGQVIRLREGALQQYADYHASAWPEVLKTITACNIRNYSIFHAGGLLFSYFEYHGDDIAADWARMGECPHTQKWWKIMEPMQQPVEFCDSDEWWCTMTEVFHHE